MRLTHGLGALLCRCSPLLATVAVVACSEDATGPRPVPTAISVATGADQAGTVGQPLDTALTVFVTDKFGDPVPGVLVRFAVPSRSGSLAPLAQTTSPSGHAHTTWSLPTAAGAYQASARAAGLDSVTFHAIAVPAAPATLELVAGDSQVALAAAPVDSAVSVMVRDGYGNPVAGVSVTFQPGAESGAAAPSVTRSDSTGRAHTIWTLGDAGGLQALVVRVDSLRPIRVVARALGRPAIPEVGMLEALDGENPGADASLFEPSAITARRRLERAAPERLCWQNALGTIALLPDTAGRRSCEMDPVVF
jgi:hypothetical protein